MNSFPNIMIGSFQVDSQSTMDHMVFAALNNGCYGFDTSPSYGSEVILGNTINKFLREGITDRQSLFISDKIDGIQIFQHEGKISKCVIDSIHKLQCEYIDLVLIHWPFIKYIDIVWRELKILKNTGLIRYIGLCNVTKTKLNEIYNIVGEYPDFVQNEISPLNIDIDIEYFKSKNIIIQAYSPLARMIKPIKDSKILSELCHKYNKDIGQIILKWHIQRGVIPIFTSKNAERIKTNLSIFDFNLLLEEILLINQMDCKYKIFPYSYGCPGY